MNTAQQSNYAAERFAAHGSDYTVEELSVEQIELLPMIDVHAKAYDEPFGYGAYDDADDDKFELSIAPCMRAFDNNFND